MPLKLLARQQITPIVSQYWEESPGRAIVFYSFYNIATIL